MLPPMDSDVGERLNPDDALVKDFGLAENCYVHCVVTAAPPRLRLPSLTPEQAAEEREASPFRSSRVEARRAEVGLAGAPWLNIKKGWGCCCFCWHARSSESASEPWATVGHLSHLAHFFVVGRWFACDCCYSRPH